MTDKQRLEEVFDDSEVVRTLEYLEAKYPRLRDLSRESKVFVVASFLKKSGLDKIQSIKRFMYKREIVPIEEFLTSKYIGDEAIFYPAEEGKVGHVWRKALCEIYAKGSPIREVILTGAIGTAKTSVSKIIHFYNTYRITSLRYPQLTMGSVPGKWINLQFMSVTRWKAKSTLLDPFKDVLRRSTHAFIEVGSIADFHDFESKSLEGITPWLDDGDQIIFPNNVRIVEGSRDHHALGEDLYGASLDEAEFRIVSKSVDQVFETYSQMVERIRSRFLYAPYTIATLVSSIGQATGVISSYIKMKLQSGDHRTAIYSHSIWEVRYPEEMSKGKWYVLVGSNHHPSAVLSEEEVKMVESGSYKAPAGTELIQIPIRFLPDFRANVDRSLRNLAGIVTSGDEQLIPSVEHIIDENLASEVTIEVSLDDKGSLLDRLKFNSSLFLRDLTGNVKLSRYPMVRRYVHLDLAEVSEAGLSMVHKEFEPESGRIVIVPDLVLRITTRDRIPLSLVLDFLKDLKEKCNVFIQTLSADQFQSTMLLQQAMAQRIAGKITRLSVDREVDQYKLLSNLIFEGRVRIGNCPILADQLCSLYLSGKKVYTKKRKDLADSFCGAVFLAESETLDSPTVTYSKNKQVTKFKLDLSNLQEVNPGEPSEKRI